MMYHSEAYQVEWLDTMSGNQLIMSFILYMYISTGSISIIKQGIVLLNQVHWVCYIVNGVETDSGIYQVSTGWESYLPC